MPGMSIPRTTGGDQGRGCCNPARRLRSLGDHCERICSQMCRISVGEGSCPARSTRRGAAVLCLSAISETPCRRTPCFRLMLLREAWRQGSAFFSKKSAQSSLLNNYAKRAKWSPRPRRGRRDFSPTSASWVKLKQARVSQRAPLGCRVSGTFERACGVARSRYGARR